ncbi:MAG: winged helix-turn-helix domain-containing protein [Pseudomonadota bacterium]
MFEDCTLDLLRRELRRDGTLVPIEPMAFDLIAFLIKERHRVVSKQELVDAVWNGRFIADSSLSTAVKTARRALGDSGQAQRFIKTVHGKGFRFFAEVQQRAPATVANGQEERSPIRAPGHGAGRPSIAVLRFLSLDEDTNAKLLASALPAELISALSRLKWLHVIARGSSFRFPPESFVPQDVIDQLNVGYILCGDIAPRGGQLAVSLELQSAAHGTLVWADQFTFPAAEIEAVRAQIIAATVSKLEASIPEFEAAETRKLSETQFDAWSHFHLGLTQAFRFNADANHAAAKHFEAALDFDPGFARAHAGNSFVHWQNAFMRIEADREEHLSIAAAEAKRALEIDPNDPFSNFCMGRAVWLNGDVDAGLNWLDRGLHLNPNFAQGYYTRGLLLNMQGEYDEAHASTIKAKSLSPLDPLFYGMLTNQMVSEVALGNFEAAMGTAEQAVTSPGAYYYPLIWAAITAELSGKPARMQRWRDKALSEWPDASAAAILQTFPLSDAELRHKVQGSLERLGIR